MSSSSPTATKPDIVLNSPVGAKPAIYKWPFHYVSKGQKIDGAEEIIETIRWVAREFIEFKPAIENILPEQIDTKDYDFIQSLCDRYNKILETVLKLNKGTSVAPKTSTRASQGLLKHIIQQVYNYAVADPTELNKYSPFSSETYGETNFEFMAQLIEKNQFRPKENDIFIDMGSGVGHIVLQTAASVECKKCYGIEISDVPAGYAKRMEERFKFWMAWHGKIYTEFELIHGDFFSNKYADIIRNATYILVNNYAFKPEVDHKLKKKFEDLNDGAQILSSKPFCSPKARVSGERHLSDIGSLMRVVEIHPELKKDTVSWTPKPLPYYLHIIDCSPIHKYYERQNRRNGRSVERGRPSKRKKTDRGPDSDADSDDNVVYGPTTRKAWSEWCNSTNASNRVSADSVKSSRNNSTDTENYESAIENEENANTNASAVTTAATTKLTKENETPTKREKKIQETQSVATEKTTTPAQGTSAQTKASQSASQAAKSCLDKKRDYASKKGAPSNATQNEKSYSCLTKASDSSNSSSPSKVPPLVIKVTPPVETKSTEEPQTITSSQIRNEAVKTEPKVNDENGKKLRQRKRPTPAQTKNEKPTTAPKETTGKQGTRASKAAAQNSTPSTSVTRGSKRTQQAAKVSAPKAAPASKRRATTSDKTSSLDLLHTKTVESVSSNAGYFPQPAPGCEDYNLRSIVETPSLPRVIIKDVGMYSDYVTRSKEKWLGGIEAEVEAFLKKTQQPGSREILTEQIRQEQVRNAMLMREHNELERVNKMLDERALKAMKPHCDLFNIKNSCRSLVSFFGSLLRRHQDLTAQVGQLEANLHINNQRTMNPPAAHSNSSQCLSSPYHRSSSSSVTLDLSLK